MKSKQTTPLGETSMTSRKLILIPATVLSVAVLAIIATSAESSKQFLVPAAEAVSSGKNFTFDATVAAQFGQPAAQEITRDVITNGSTPIHTSVLAFDPPTSGLDPKTCQFGGDNFVSTGEPMDDANISIKVDLNNITSISVNFGVKDEVPFCCNISCAFFTLEDDTFNLLGGFTFENYLDDSTHTDFHSAYRTFLRTCGEDEPSMNVEQTDPNQEDFFNDLTLTWQKGNDEINVRRVDIQMNVHNRDWDESKDKEDNGLISAGNFYVNNMTFQWAC